MITLNISPETWDKAVGRMVLGHTRHNAVSETALRSALKVLGIEVEVDVVEATCGNCRHWTPRGMTFGQDPPIDAFMGTCGWMDSLNGTSSGHTCQGHTPEGSE